MLLQSHLVACKPCPEAVKSKYRKAVLESSSGRTSYLGAKQLQQAQMEEQQRQAVQPAKGAAASAPALEQRQDQPGMQPVPMDAVSPPPPATPPRQTAMRPYVLHDCLPPEVWLSIVVSELLQDLGCQIKMPRSVCKLPFVKTTEHLRLRLEKYEEAFFRTMTKLALCVCKMLTDSDTGIEVDSRVLSQQLCERIPAELLARQFAHAPWGSGPDSDEA